MNDWRDVSTGSGVRRRIRFHENENLIETEIKQPNMGAILDQNQRELNWHATGRIPAGWVKVASVPFWLIEHWKNTEGLDYFNPDHRDALFLKYNSNEYSKLRTAPGHIVAHHTEW